MQLRNEKLDVFRVQNINCVLHLLFQKKRTSVKTSKTKDPCKTTFFRGTKKVMTMKKNYYLDSLDCLDNGQLKNMESNNSF